MSSQTQPINLHLYLHSTQTCLEGQQVLEHTITTIPHANQYTHTIHIQDLIIDNFSPTNSVISKNTVLGKLLIFNNKRYELITVPQHIFSNMERNMLKRTSVNSLQYLSSVLNNCYQDLEMNLWQKKHYFKTIILGIEHCLIMSNNFQI